MRHLKMIWARISSHQLFRIARFSRPVVSLLRFFRKRERLSFASSVEFYSKLSQHRMRLVFDIGANRGDKTEVFVKFLQRLSRSIRTPLIIRFSE